MKSTKSSPIALFVHARPLVTRRTVESLLSNPEASQCELHVFSDGARNRPGEAAKVEAVRDYVRALQGFGRVIVHEAAANQGLGGSIISGVSNLLEIHGRVIVLEDDLQVSSGFLAYMNQALEVYAGDSQVLSISGYSYPIRYPKEYPWDVAFGIRASSWGWATWRDRWQGIDWSVSDYEAFRHDSEARRGFNLGGSDMCRMLDRQQRSEIQSWAIRFCYHQFKHGMVDVFPVRSLVENIGWGSAASNCDMDVRAWRTDFWSAPPSSFCFPREVQTVPEIIGQFRAFNGLRARAMRVVKRRILGLRHAILQVRSGKHPGRGGVLVSNSPAPYREPVYEMVAKDLTAFTVLYCQPVEPDRQWKFPLGNYPMKFLKGKSFTYNLIYLHHVHWNPGIWTELNRLDPAVVITNGYNPSHLMAFLWTRLKGRKHVAMTDGWLKSEEHLTVAHRLLRRLVLSQTAAFLGASNRSLEMLQHYGAKMQDCFLSYLCGNNDLFARTETSGAERPYDLMFSGQFIERKMPGFFVEVARQVKAVRPGLRVLLIGDGPLREQTLKALQEAEIDYEYPGFLNQEELPSWYASAKLFLFPTLQECWGVVVNEACAAGTPVITCDNTAVDGELVLDGENGLVLPLDAKLWAARAVELLEDQGRWEKYSRRSKEVVVRYSYEIAACGIVDVVQYLHSS